MEYFFDNPLFLTLIITFPIFIIAGVLMLKFPPKNRNNLYGYRTKQSLSSKEKWHFAQKYSAIQMIKVGVLGCAVAFFSLYFKTSSTFGSFIGIGIILVFSFYPIYKTEKALKKKFGK